MSTHLKSLFYTLTLACILSLLPSTSYAANSSNEPVLPSAASSSSTNGPPVSLLVSSAHPSRASGLLNPSSTRNADQSSSTSAVPYSVRNITSPSFFTSSSLSHIKSTSATSVTSISSKSPLTSATPTLTLSGSSNTLLDLQTVLQRRLGFIVTSAGNASAIPQWISTLGTNGKWPASEVDYTTGCAAQRANWPAQTHWLRILTMSAAWHGGMSNSQQYVNNSALASAISSAMNYWFQNDFTNSGCLDGGGTGVCPCGTPGLWNTNWFSNVILIPRLVGESCLLFNASLSDAQKKGCTTISSRSYDTFYEGPKGYLSGANILDVAKIGIDVALLTTNITLITEAYRRIHAEVVIEPGIMVDGIKADGSFGQHGGLLYNGNYGKDFSNDVLELEIDAGGTQFAANQDSKDAFTSLIDGDRWMIYRNVLTNVLHWDFSTLPRFITFPVIDAQATGSLNINLTEIQQLGELWNSTTLNAVYNALVKRTKNANAGYLKGTRVFYANDYMVQRGEGYVSTLKMYSTRTKNTECTNSQNPLGFHLADGTLYTYLQGNEYEDIAAAWDWNLIPGTTVDYGATPLNCASAEWTGLEAFVGGVSDGNIGIAAMRYTNPYTRALSWQKTWFFLAGGVQRVVVTSLTNAGDAPVYSVLDQRRHDGPIFVNGFPVPENISSASYPYATSLWHGNVGYTFDDPSFGLSLSVGERTGNWSAIGISTQPPATVDLFAAYIEHQDLTAPLSYTIFPGIDFHSFQGKSEDRQHTLRTLRNDALISAVLDEENGTVSIVFWDGTGGTLRFILSPKDGPISISSNGNSAIIYSFGTDKITISDPSQTLTNIQVDITRGWGGDTRSLDLELPTGGKAGSSVSMDVP